MARTTSKPIASADLERVQPDRNVPLAASLDGMISHDAALDSLKAAIAEGDADVEAGRVEDASAVFTRLRAEFGY